MKTKTSSHHHPSVHIKIERFFRHRGFLVVVLSFMAIGLIKYEAHLLGMLQQLYAQGYGFVSVYAHHEEITRMPVQFGSNVRNTPISGE